MYRRLATGVVDRGQTEAFLKAMAASRSYQAERGIRARTTVWGAITGPTNSVVIASDFERLDELEDYLDLATQDAAFAQLRRDLRATMVADASRVSVLRLSFHSDGLMTSEDATAPRRYMRTLAGDVRPGHHRDFVMAVSHALQYQAQKGVDARTSVWASVTGVTSAVQVIGEFDSLSELEKFDEMGRRDPEFARLRTATRENMVFLTSQVQLMRNML
jgi:hypothetical protein